MRMAATYGTPPAGMPRPLRRGRTGREGRRRVLRRDHAACLAVAEATRELHGGIGLDITALDLLTLNSDGARAAEPGDVISARLLA